MKNQEHPTIFRKDYTPPPYLIDSIYLTFRLAPKETRVTALSQVKKNPDGKREVSIFCLNGEDLILLSIKIDGVELEKKRYSVTPRTLEITNVPDSFSLEITTIINPQENTSLNGLYRSSGNYCTQCEAEGFRKITYYTDRPDVLARFTTRIEAEKDLCPVMLSNGNLVEKGTVEENVEYTIWTDPFPKPCYLFALVAGDLVSRDDHYITKSNRKITLQIFVESRNKDKCEHAMRSLKKAMKWDEDTFGLEYDLDNYMIVAVDDFNMGAMENKGLNIFNSKYVLASPETATDQDYLGIEGVIAHEYFHNWTGNRVTCRDWFQLSLKEGLTVFRDQEFSADMNSRPVQRIDDVDLLRNFQFREDAGPMTHSVRPDSYIEINNFYTVTVYNKGAEVVRMIHSLLGVDSFRAGMDLYFERHDGQAVTCDDFVKAMSDASGTDLTQFMLWYSQSGTPSISVREKWDESTRNYSLTLQQKCTSTPGQKVKDPFHIPISIGLLDSNGRDMELILDKNGKKEGDAKLLELKKDKEVFTFKDIQERPVLSFLRGYTAPVKVDSFQDKDELAFIMAHDNDLYNRWDAASRLSETIILDLTAKKLENGYELDEMYIHAFRQNLFDEKVDKALIAKALTLPTETYLAQQMTIIEPDALHRARKFVQKSLRTHLLDDFKNVYHLNRERGKFDISPDAMGRRSLKNLCLEYIMATDNIDKNTLQMCLEQYRESENMTDVIGSLKALSSYHGKEREETLEAFYQKWQNDPLVVDKWLILQATSSIKNTLDRVKELLKHRAFSIHNPNKVRSLIGAFCNSNHVCFHASSGAGYRFLAEQIIILDKMNPQIAARLVTPFTIWKRYDQKRRMLMHEQLMHLSMQSSLSADVSEIVEKSL